MDSTGELTRLGLEVRFDARPIHGRLFDPDGRLDRPFSGWLGLMAALDAARSGAEHTAGEQRGAA